MALLLDVVADAALADAALDVAPAEEAPAAGMVWLEAATDATDATDAIRAERAALWAVYTPEERRFMVEDAVEGFRNHAARRRRELEDAIRAGYRAGEPKIPGVEPAPTDKTWFFPTGTLPPKPAGLRSPAALLIYALLVECTDWISAFEAVELAQTDYQTARRGMDQLLRHGAIVLGPKRKTPNGGHASTYALRRGIEE